MWFPHHDQFGVDLIRKAGSLNRAASVEALKRKVDAKAKAKA